MDQYLYIYLHTELVIKTLQSELWPGFFQLLMSFVSILCMSGMTYSLISTLNYRFLKNFSWQFYLFSKFLLEIEICGNEWIPDRRKLYISNPRTNALKSHTNGLLLSFNL